MIGAGIMAQLWTGSDGKLILTDCPDCPCAPAALSNQCCPSFPRTMYATAASACAAINGKVVTFEIFSVIETGLSIQWTFRGLATGVGSCGTIYCIAIVTCSKIDNSFTISYVGSMGAYGNTSQACFSTPTTVVFQCPLISKTVSTSWTTIGGCNCCTNGDSVTWTFTP